jgi:hypothetical protein
VADGEAVELHQHRIDAGHHVEQPVGLQVEHQLAEPAASGLAFLWGGGQRFQHQGRVTEGRRLDLQGSVRRWSWRWLDAHGS